MNIEKNSIESKALNFMRFPLASLIVLLHTGITYGPENFTYYLANYINTPIVQLAVPTFFFISGYLFFIGKNVFNFNTYTNKLKKKVATLIIPYIIWNLIAIVFIYFYQYIKKESIEPWSLTEIFWAHGEGIQTTSILNYKYPVIISPAAGVLWFMRDLIIMMICSIIIYPIIKHLKWWIFPILLLINFLKLGIPIPGFSLTAITFFYSGAFFSINNINIFIWLKKRPKIWLFSWPILAIIQQTLKLYAIEEVSQKLSIFVFISGVAFVFILSYILINNRNKIVDKLISLGETSFFIYAFGNTLILWILNKEIGYFLDTIPYIGHFLCYEFLFIAKIIECIFIFYIMKKYTPNLLNILIGGREVI